MLALDLRQVCKRYRAGIPGCSAGVDALRDANLQIGVGEVTGVVGGPGAGKSTLLLCASGALRPDSGTVTWSGRAARRRSPECRIAYVPDASTAYSFFTVRDVLAHHPRLRALAPDEREQRVEEAIEVASLSRWIDARFGEIPPGVARRVAIARELAGSPRLLMVDEPFAGLETAAQAQVAELLRALPLCGITVLMASRDGRAIVRACTRAIVMSEGRIHGEIDPARFQQGGRVAEVAR